jgi:hypothetical protein
MTSKKLSELSVVFRSVHTQGPSIRFGTPSAWTLEQVYQCVDDDDGLGNEQVIEASVAQPVSVSPLPLPVPVAPVAEAVSANMPEQSISLEEQLSEKSAPKKKKDGRLKGQVPRVSMNVMLDEEVLDLLRFLKASNQTTTQEGYSGILC